METDPLLVSRPEGLYCAAGDFYIDPFEPVKRAVITHAHGDHARPGSKAYLAAEPGLGLLEKRFGATARIEGLPYGTQRTIGYVRVSFHPSGHVLGSAQVRLERNGEVWVVSGDFKRQPDPTCPAFEPLACHTFFTESTFALPIYRWPAPQTVLNSLTAWWRSNQEQKLTSILFCYALGKAQRILAQIDASIGPILVHGAIGSMNDVYRARGIALPPTSPADEVNAKAGAGRALVIAPISVRTSPWVRKFQPCSTAFASGWMMLRGARRRRALDRGFVLSDHADWDGLLETIRETGASRIGVMHGQTGILTRYLREQGRDAFEIAGHHREFEGEDED